MKKWNSKYFKPHEFACQCGSDRCLAATDAQVKALINEPPEMLINILDVATSIRAGTGAPLIVSSGIRCYHHNVAAAKRRKYGEEWVGAHGVGWAVDLKWPENNPYADASMEHIVAELFLHRMVNDIGIAASFLHAGIAHPNGRINGQWQNGSVRKYPGLTASPRKKRFYEYMRLNVLPARRAG